MELNVTLTDDYCMLKNSNFNYNPHVSELNTLYHISMCMGKSQGFVVDKVYKVIVER